MNATAHDTEAHVRDGDAGGLPRRASLALRALQTLAALAFLAAGGAKLAGVPDMVAMFEAMGFGQWFRYFTGLYEIAGAVLLLVPRTAWIGAAMFVMQMAAAVVFHVALVGGSPVPAIVLLLVSAIILWYRRPGRG